MFCCSLHPKTHESMGIQDEMEEKMDRVNILTWYFNFKPVLQTDTNLNQINA